MSEPAPNGTPPADYDRPNRSWRCGRLAGGRPCPRGPDAVGTCRGVTDCAPMRRGDRWHCTRSASAGGPCQTGPSPDGQCATQRPPCAPVRSLSVWRRRVTRMAVVVMIGLVLIAVQGGERDALLSPGPLTFQHAVVGGCAGCHDGFDAGPTGWAKIAFGLSEPVHGDRACHTCHDLGPHAERAHSRPPAVTAALTRQAEQHRDEHGTTPPLEFALSAWLLTPGKEAGSQIGCATCHREHRGVDTNLTEMPEGACQSCHTVQFPAFGQGHPEFGETLFDRRSQIAFDHAAHLDRHFAATESAGKAPPACSVCHLPSDDGRVMETRSFETMCASCHLDDIAGTGAIGPKGITFLTVPGLDTRELAARGVDIGDWPQWSEEPVTPFMRRLLQQDAEVAAALDRLDGLDLLDLRDAEPEDIKAAALLAAGIKRLIGSLLEEGVAAADRLLGTTAPQREGASTAGTLLGHLPMEVLQATARDWFPRLASELPQPLPMLPATIPGPESSQGPAPEATPGTDQSDILAAPAGDQSNILAPLAPDQSNILAPPTVDQSDILAPLTPSDQSTILTPPIVDQSDILAPLAAARPKTQPPLPGAPVAAPVAPVQVETNPTPPPRLAIEPAVSPEEWMRAGGWYRDEFALRYRPTGHADRFFQAWLDIAADPPAGSDDRLLGVFNSGQAPGTCLSCHSVDRGGDGAGLVNWLPARNDPARRDFFRFAHAPHFSLIAEDGCQTCHAVTRTPAGSPASAFQEQYSQGDPHTGVVVGFSSPKAETCAQCHAPGRAGDTCTQCHAYHVGRFEAPTVATPMEIKPP